MLIRNYNYSGQEAVERFVKTLGDECIIWDRIIATAGNIEATNIPATFQVQLKEFYTNPQTGNNIIWTNANATEHMGEYVARFGGENFSTNLRSHLMLESYVSSLDEAIASVIHLTPDTYFGVYGGWEIGINTKTGIVYHALYIG